MAWNLSCPDWPERLRSGRSLLPDLPLDMAQADRAVAVFNRLKLADVPGTPTLDMAAGDWFRDIVRALFGSIDPVSGERHIREILTLVPKKNSKTSYGALLMLTALLLNKRPKAKFIMTAPTQDITELAFNQAEGAIGLDPVLDAKCHVRSHLKTIVHRQTGATLEVMTFNPSVLTGQKPAGILLDELHVCAKMSKAASAIRQLRGGMLPFPEAFFVFITTQSEEPPTGTFKAELTKARAIRDGKQSGIMLPVLYELPEEIQRSEEAWRNPIHWPMVTPNRGRSISIERLLEGFHTAETTGPDELRAWASQHLNLEIGLSLGTDRWAGADFWESCGDAAITLEAILERCEVAVVGIDGGGLDDLLGLTVLGRCRETRRWLIWCHAWAHKIVLDRRKEIAPRLLDFEKDGNLTIVTDPAQAVTELADVVMRVEQAELLAEQGIGVDAAGIGEIVDELTGRGIALDRIIGISQGWKLNGAIKTAERRLASGTAAHGGRAMMAWCVGNARIVQAGNAVSITKQASGTAKIDPLMSTFNAVALMATNPAARGPSVYATRGLLIL
ncbi:terminase large subunit [Azospirillum agricola]|uniref:terminase large subunit n=1 Tax=Azospirillum agricola TaxID=1720247 RepID=UPI000A0F3069|nr:terminase large subunit [Azospirillum agricola]SMH30581.1 Phage terminase-like protein, large subunit, contains N-terminal HTH domain [Azospirillum lipoferum]